jgi:hypothetical protein
MITSNERQSVGNGYLSVGEFYGLSTDTKPTNTANGSTFFEMDTGKMYRYNFAAHTWTQTTHYGNTGGFGPAPSGGGSGSGGVLVCHADEATRALDHTWQEIVDAGFSVLLLPGGDETMVAWFAVYGVVYPSGEAKWEVVYFSPDGPYTFFADSADAYPVAYNPGSGDDSGGGGNA